MANHKLNYPSDTILLERIQNGDNDAIDILILKYKPLLMAIIRGEIGYENAEDVSDVFQEICYAVLRRLRKNPKGISVVEKWLKQVARSKCKQYWRDVKKHREVIALAEEARNAALAQEIRRALRQNEAFEVIENLNPIHREVLELWLQDWTMRDIAKHFGIPENTATSRKATAIRKLREHFGVLPSSKKKKKG